MQIPKILLQTGKQKNHPQINELFKYFFKDYKHDFYVINNESDDCILYFKNNKLEGFENIIDKFNSFTNGAHKSDLFRYYYLYLNGGVYIDTDFMIEKKIEDIIKDYECVFVNSNITKKSMLNAFIAVSPKNEIIYNALINVYNTNNEILQNDYLYICKDLYNIIFNNDVNLKINMLVEYYDELNVGTKATIVDKYNEIIGYHYNLYKIIPIGHYKKIIFENCNFLNNIKYEKQERNLFFYWTGKEYSLIKILRNLIFEHSENNKNYIVHYITDENLNEYVKELPECFKKLLPAHKADYIRIYIIAKYGGIWLDSDTLVMSNLKQLFDILDYNEGFFIKENNDVLWNGVFGSRKNTKLMNCWLLYTSEILKLKKSNISWTEIGNDLLENIAFEFPEYFKNYKIFNGLDTIYPVNFTNCVEKYLIEDYDKNINLQKCFQPLICLVNSVYKYLENSTEEQILNSDMPLNYFINLSKQNIGKNIIYKNSVVDFDEYFMKNKIFSILKIEKDLKVKINNNIHYGIFFLEYIKSNRTIIYYKNKYIFCDYFKIIYNKNLDLENIHDFNFILDNILTTKELHNMNILLYYSTMSHILFESQEQIEIYRNYKLQILDILLEKLPDCIYPTLSIFLGSYMLNLTYYFIYNGKNNTELYSKICKLYRKIVPPLKNIQKIKPNKDTNRKIKIAFIDNCIIQNHSVAKDRIGVFEHLLKNKKFYIRILTDNKNEETYNTFFKENKNLISFLDDNIDLIPQQITLYNFDIIIFPQIGLDQKFRLLSMHRMAPIQITTWGNSETSGIDTIDYYISSQYFENSKDNINYSEKLIKMNSLSTYYYDHNSKLEKNIKVIDKLKSHLKIPENANIYGCLQLYHKFHPKTINCFQKILEKDNNSYLILFDFCDEMSLCFKDYINNFLGCYENRIKYLGYTDGKSFCTYIDMCDILLDIITFGGCNSSFDSFARNKIVICYQTNLLCSSFTSGFYKKMGITEFICKSEEEYIDKAIYYANNKDKRNYFETLINQNKYKIFEEKESLYEWENFLLEIIYK